MKATEHADDGWVLWPVASTAERPSGWRVDTKTDLATEQEGPAQQVRAVPVVCDVTKLSEARQERWRVEGWGCAVGEGVCCGACTVRTRARCMVLLSKTDLHNKFALYL